MVGYRTGQHSLANETDPWSKTCGPLWNGTCTLQHPPLPPLNNTAVTAYWRAAAAWARDHGWLDRAFFCGVGMLALPS